MRESARAAVGRTGSFDRVRGSRAPPIGSIPFSRRARSNQARHRRMGGMGGVRDAPRRNRDGQENRGTPRTATTATRNRDTTATRLAISTGYERRGSNRDAF